MISNLQRAVEIDKLEAVIGTMDPALRRAAGTCSVEGIRSLRNAALDGQGRLYAARFRRLARMAKLMRLSQVASMAQRMGPLLSARLLPFFEPHYVGRVARRLSADFIAAATAEADPRVLRSLVAHIEPDQVAEAASLLITQEHYVHAGQLTDALDPQAIRAILDRVDDNVALLRTVIYMEQPDKLGNVIRLVDNARLNEIILAGAADRTVWPLMLWMIDQVGRDLKGRITNLMVVRDPEVLNELIRVADQQGLWGPILRAIDTVKARHRPMLVHLEALRDEATLGHLVRAAYDEGLMANTLPLIDAMNGDLQAYVTRVGMKMGGTILETFVQTAIQEKRGDLILTLMGRLQDQELDELATLSVFTDSVVLGPLIRAAISSGQISTLMRFARVLSRRSQELFASLLALDHGALFERLLNRADNLREVDWKNLMSVLGRLKSPGQFAGLAEVVQWQSAKTYSTLKGYAENAGLALFGGARS
ncbi:hypothetical protein [Marinobacter mobilis]|uniref:Uncharacterized protein n=1 Tax=Marinobacter mobilis TaxID=488533 RepID=A0A1H2PZ20_9GAMM|nr:hypothetical protein [Marinobacter mobilis]SDW00115.1 hypothetical protein SAMN04487960_10144 [Marinobacter mobilis]